MRGMPWILAAACLGACAVRTPDALRGAWHTDRYILQEGTEHEVEGLIFFTETDWAVLFFVTGVDGEPRRGSAEGGTYTADGRNLVFRHHYNLSYGDAVSGLAESPLRMSLAGDDDAAAEPCELELEGDRLTLSFPSGNSMTFLRSSTF